jgi:IMP dehydrogenase
MRFETDGSKTAAEIMTTDNLAVVREGVDPPRPRDPARRAGSSA